MSSADSRSLLSDESDLHSIDKEIDTVHDDNDTHESVSSTSASTTSATVVPRSRPRFRHERVKTNDDDDTIADNHNYTHQTDDNDADDDDGKIDANIEKAKNSRVEHKNLLPRLLSFLYDDVYLGFCVSVSYLIAESRRVPIGLFVGLLTVVLVVFVIALLRSAVLMSPVIFVKIAENSVGENDLILSPGTGVAGKISSFPNQLGGLPLLNQSLFDQAFIGQQNELVEGPGSAPRWLWLGSVINNDQEQQGLPVTPSSAILLGLSSAREAAIKLGRSWPYHALGVGECILSSSIVREIQLSHSDSGDDNSVVGRTVTFSSNLISLYTQLTANSADQAVVTDAQAQATAAEAAQSMSNNNNNERDAVLFERTIIERMFAPKQVPWNDTVNTPQLLSIVTGQPVGAGTGTGTGIPLTNFTSIIHALGLDSNGNFTLIASLLDEYLPVLVPALSNLNSSAIADNINRVLTLAGANANVTAEQVDVFRAYLKTQVDAPDDGVSDVDTSNLPNNDITNNPTFRLLIHLYRLSIGTETYGQLLSLVTPLLSRFLTFTFPLRIAGVVREPDGKWSDQIGSVVVVENMQLQAMMREVVDRLINVKTTVSNDTTIDLGEVQLFGFDLGRLTIPIPPALRNNNGNNHSAVSWPARVVQLLNINGTAPLVSDIDSTLLSLQAGVSTYSPTSYSMLTVVQYHDRMNAYMSTLLGLKAHMLHFTNSISEAIGVTYPATYTLPVALVLQQTIYVRYFLDNIFGSVLVMLVGLGSLLVFALLLNDVKGKTYEYGMLRALGMPARTLIQLLTTKALMFSLPGIALGLFIAWLLYIPIALLVGQFAHLDPVFELAPSAILLSSLIGVIMPLIANIVPIERAFSSTLRDSLDLYHQVTSEVTVKMMKLEELGLDVWQTAISVLLIVFGFITFYVIPYAFTFNNIPLFLGVLNAILLAMLLGLCVVASTLQPFIERLILFLICVYRRRALLPIVRKNLHGHSDRNAKTAIMFTVSLAFLIFASAMFDLQSRELGDNVKVFNGADLNVMAPMKNPKYALREADMTAYLNSQLHTNGRGGVVQNFTFVAYALNYLRPVTYASLSNLPQQPRYRSYIYGVSANYLDVAYSEFLLLSSSSSSSSSELPLTEQGEVDPIKLMYVDAGRARLPIEDEASQSENNNNNNNNNNNIYVYNGIRVPGSIATGVDIHDIGLGSGSNRTLSNARMRLAYVSYLDVLVTSALSDAASVHVSTPLTVQISARPPGVDPSLWNGVEDQQYRYLAKARALITKCPGFIYSSYRQTASIGPLLLRMDAYQDIINRIYGQAEGTNYPIPKYRLLVRFTSSASASSRSDIINGLRTFIRSSDVLVIDTLSVLSSLSSAVGLLQLFFAVVGVLAMTMCATMLWLSFKSNVEESAWELAVLRSLGLTKTDIVCVYVYESASIVLTSVILGSAIGLVISVSLTAQFIAFLEMPFRMVFPYTLFATMLMLAAAVAAVGSYLPARELLKAPISSVLRRA